MCEFDFKSNHKDLEAGLGIVFKYSESSRRMKKQNLQQQLTPKLAPHNSRKHFPNNQAKISA